MGDFAQPVGRVHILGKSRIWPAMAIPADSELARRWSTLNSPGRDGKAEHRAIEEAALARNADLAADLLHRHLSRTAAGLTRTEPEKQSRLDVPSPT